MVLLSVTSRLAQLCSSRRLRPTAEHPTTTCWAVAGLVVSLFVLNDTRDPQGVTLHSTSSIVHSFRLENALLG